MLPRSESDARLHDAAADDIHQRFPESFVCPAGKYSFPLLPHPCYERDGFACGRKITLQNHNFNRHNGGNPGDTAARKNGNCSVCRGLTREQPENWSAKGEQEGDES